MKRILARSALYLLIAVLSLGGTEDARAGELIASVKNFNAAIEGIIHSDDALFSLGGQDIYYDHQDENALKMHLEDQWSLAVTPAKGDRGPAAQDERWVKDDYYGSFRFGIGLEYEFSY